MMRVAIFLLLAALSVVALREQRIFQQAPDYLLFEADEYTGLVDGNNGDSCKFRKEIIGGGLGIRAPGTCTSGSGFDPDTSKANYLLQFKHPGKYELWARVANSNGGNNGAFMSREFNGPPSHPVRMQACETVGCSYGFGWARVGSGGSTHTLIVPTGAKEPLTFQVAPMDDMLFDKFAFVSVTTSNRVNLAQVMVSHPMSIEVKGPATSFEGTPDEHGYSSHSSHQTWVSDRYQFSGSSILRFTRLVMDSVSLSRGSMLSFNLAFPDPSSFTFGLRIRVHGETFSLTSEEIAAYPPGKWIRKTYQVDRAGSLQIEGFGKEVLIDSVVYMEHGTQGGTCCTDVSRFPRPVDGCISNMVISRADCRTIGGTFLEGLNRCDECTQVEIDDCEQTDMLFAIDSSVQNLQACKDFVTNFFDSEGLSSTGLRAGVLFFGSTDDISRTSGLTYRQSRIREIIDTARPTTGATCISCGLNDASIILDRNARENARKIVVIITDGITGSTDTDPSPSCGRERLDCARDFFGTQMSTCSTKEDEDAQLDACASYLQARADIVSSIIVVGDESNEAVVKSLASSEDYFFNVKDTANLDSLIDVCEDLACAPPLLATSAGQSPLTCTAFSPSLSTVGTFKLADHPTGSAAPPAFCLRLDELVPGIGTFSCESWELFLSVDFPQNIVHIFGTVNGGLDTGNQISNPTALNIKMVYTGVTNEPGENGGTAVVSATPAFGTLSFGGNTYNVQSTSMGEHLRIQTGTAGAPADTYVLTSGAGYIQVALPGDAFSGAPIVNDFLAVVGPCIADRFDATAPLCTLPEE
mmetsp:Transcript_8128/g.9003  ORF Transcript_8128/g.9003 Transcript_8128/m.9003 type:complete len:811 (-) Transcript_8128:98-2530(-)